LTYRLVAIVVTAMVATGCAQTRPPKDEFETRRDAQLTQDEQLARVQRVFLEAFVEPVQASEQFRNAFAAEMKRAGVEVTEGQRIADATLRITAEVKPEKVGNAQRVTADYRYKLELPGHGIVTAGNGHSVRGDSARAVLAELGNELGRKIRIVLHPGMGSVDRINVNVLGHDEFSNRLTTYIAEELAKAGFSVTSFEDSDAALTIVLNVSDSPVGHRIGYMYATRIKRDPREDIAPFWDEMSIKDDPNATLKLIAQLVGCRYAERKKSALTPGSSDRRDCGNESFPKSFPKFPEAKKGQ
jgi:hypothetical protein